MTISAIGTHAGVIPPSSAALRSNGLAFDRALASAGGDVVAISPAAQALSGPASKPASQSTDYDNMTPRQFAAAAQSMYDDGKISLDQLFKMEMAAGVCDHGKTVLTAAPDAPMDFTEYFQDQLAGEMGRGDVNGKGYQDTLAILGILTDRA